MRLIVLFAFVLIAQAARADAFTIQCDYVTDGGALVGFGSGHLCKTSFGHTVDVSWISLGAIADTGEGIPTPTFYCDGELRSGKNVLYGAKAGVGAGYGKGVAKWANRRLSCYWSGTTYPMGFQLAGSRLVIVY